MSLNLVFRDNRHFLLDPQRNHLGSTLTLQTSSSLQWNCIVLHRWAHRDPEHGGTRDSSVSGIIVKIQKQEKTQSDDSYVHPIQGILTLGRTNTATEKKIWIRTQVSSTQSRIHCKLNLVGNLNRTVNFQFSSSTSVKHHVSVAFAGLTEREELGRELGKDMARGHEFPSWLTFSLKGKSMYHTNQILPVKESPNTL